MTNYKLIIAFLGREALFGGEEVEAWEPPKSGWKLAAEGEKWTDDFKSVSKLRIDQDEEQFWLKENSEFTFYDLDGAGSMRLERLSGYWDQSAAPRWYFLYNSDLNIFFTIEKLKADRIGLTIDGIIKILEDNEKELRDDPKSMAGINLK